MTTKEFLSKIKELGFEYRVVFSRKGMNGKYVSREIMITYEDEDVALVDLYKEYSLNLAYMAMIDLPDEIREESYEAITEYVGTSKEDRENEEDNYYYLELISPIEIIGYNKYLAYDVLNDDYILVNKYDGEEFTVKTKFTFNDILELDRKYNVFANFRAGEIE